jgi:putative heme transporter
MRPEAAAPTATRPGVPRRQGMWRRWIPAASRGRTPLAFCGRSAWAWVLAAGVIAVAVVRSPSAAGDVRAAVGHLGGLRLAWLGAAAAAQIVSLAGGAAVQLQLLAMDGARLRWGIVFGLVFASTGIARLMPAGPVAGGAWQVREYHRRGVDAAAGVWAVLCGGLTSTVAAMALLLAGAAMAGIGSLPLLGCAALMVAAGMAGLTTARRGVGAFSRWLRRHRRWLAINRLTSAMSGLSRQHAGYGWAAAVLACTGTSLLADAGVFAACFGLAGLPVPWRALLFAYAAGQLAGRLLPLPGGLGGMEGGAFGALTLTGMQPSAAVAALVVYRIAGYWLLGTVGAASAVALAGRARRPAGGAPPQPAQTPPSMPGPGSNETRSSGWCWLRGTGWRLSQGGEAAGADGGERRDDHCCGDAGLSQAEVLGGDADPDHGR